MGDTIKFTPNTGNSTDFAGHGSKIEHPDILPVFRGSYWPGSGDLTVLSVMNALNSLVNGSYLQGLTQYGYVGPAQVRTAIIDTSDISINPPPLMPGVNQTDTFDQITDGYISWLLDKKRIDNVDDNHDLIVMIIYDPSSRQPINMDANGVVTPPIAGDNGEYDKVEILDDNIRFTRIWVVTADTNANQLPLANVTQAISHELVEAISDPFGTGWSQISPKAGENLGQIADVCNQPAIVNGVSVVAYWSEGDCKCIVPTSTTRSLSVSFTLDQHNGFDGREKTGYVHLPLMCGGDQYFKYFERTYRNKITIHTNLVGYESPVIEYKINNLDVPFLEGTLEVDAVWEPEPPSNPFFPDFDFKPPTATLETLRLSPADPQISIWVGPNAGNTLLTISVVAYESFDDPSSGYATTRKSIPPLQIDLRNQEIIWEGNHDAVIQNCQDLENLVNGLGVVLGPPQPGDPAELVDIVARALRDYSQKRAEHIREVAELVQYSRPAVAEALLALAERVS